MNSFLANHFQNNNEMLNRVHDNKSRVFVFVIPNVFRDPGLGFKAPRPVGEVLYFFSPGWSPTGKPVPARRSVFRYAGVVPNNHTHLRQWALKLFGAQAPGLRWVIRSAAKSAEAWQIHRLKVSSPELRIPPRPRPWSPA